MKCPKCGNAAPDGAAFCPVCYEVLRKEKPAEVLAAPAPATPRVEEPLFAFELEDFKVPALAALAPALIATATFKDALPINEFWGAVKNGVLLWAVNTVFHEAGHTICALFCPDTLVAFMGNGFETLVPAVFAGYFFIHKQRVGVLVCLFWMGHTMIDWAFYLADAKLQALILITGTSGQEGGPHDWAYVLDAFKMKDKAVGLGQAVFFAGNWLMALPIALAAATWRRRTAKTA